MKTLSLLIIALVVTTAQAKMTVFTNASAATHLLSNEDAKQAIDKLGELKTLSVEKSNAGTFSIKNTTTASEGSTDPQSCVAVFSVPVETVKHGYITSNKLGAPTQDNVECAAE